MKNHRRIFYAATRLKYIMKIVVDFSFTTCRKFLCFNRFDALGSPVLYQFVI